MMVKKLRYCWRCKTLLEVKIVVIGGIKQFWYSCNNCMCVYKPLLNSSNNVIKYLLIET